MLSEQFVSHMVSDIPEVENGDVSFADGDITIATDGVNSVHISVADSIEDDRSSVEILSPTFSNHYKHTGMLRNNINVFPIRPFHLCGNLSV